MSTPVRVPVLMYHRVGEAHNAWEAKYAISAEDFAAHMHALFGKGYRAVTVDALLDWCDGSTPLPAGAFVLTFDDGYRGVRDHALPLLEALGWPFTVFLISDLVGGQDVWTRISNPDGGIYPLLAEDEIRDMQERGVGFHSHTRSHPSLPTLDDRQLAEELGGSRSTLSILLGREVCYLAYPFGHLDDRVEAATRAAGYRAAFSTQPGFNRKDVNPFRMRRIDVFGTDTPAALLRKIKFGCNDGTLWNVFCYYLGRLRSHLPGTSP